MDPSGSLTCKGIGRGSFKGLLARQLLLSKFQFIVNDVIDFIRLYISTHNHNVVQLVNSLFNGILYLSIMKGKYGKYLESQLLYKLLSFLI